MDDFPVFARHVGVWEGTYTLIDRSGRALDHHKSRMTCAIDGDKWSQTDHYTWEDGRQDVKAFDGTLQGDRLVFDTPRIKGEAFEVAPDTIVLRWKYTREPENAYAAIVTLVDDNHRCRTWQHFENGELVKLTVIDERRIS